VSPMMRRLVPGGSCRRVMWISPPHAVREGVFEAVRDQLRDEQATRNRRRYLQPHGLSVHPQGETVAGRAVRLKELLTQPGEVLGGVHLGHHIA
jgi:hypothetical protein